MGYLKETSRNANDGQGIQLFQQAPVDPLEPLHLRLHYVDHFSRVFRTGDHHPRIPCTNVHPKGSAFKDV